MCTLFKKSTKIHLTQKKETWTESVKNDRDRFTVGRLTIGAVNQVIVAADERKQQISDEEDLSRRNDQSYRKVKVGVGASGVDPQVPQNRRHDDADAEHYC